MEQKTCRSCGLEMSAETTFCDGCGAMAPALRSQSHAPHLLMAAGGYSTGYSPEFYGGGGFAAAKDSSSTFESDSDSDDEYTYVHAPRPYLWMGTALAVLAAMLFAGVWWWNRGADMTVAIAPTDSQVTMDGAPLAMANGEAVLPAVKRGQHLFVVKVPDGGTLYRSVDVGFFATTQQVTINLSKAAPLVHSARMAEPHYGHARRAVVR